MKNFKGSMLIVFMIFAMVFSISGQEDAADLTPLGYWKTIDDDTLKVKSIVKIWKEPDGTLKGKILKLFRTPEEEQNPLCDKCKGDKKDQPILGMEFLWGFKGQGAEWEDGSILDPKNGKTYHCQLEVVEQGKKLKVFGYIRIIFKIGRTQVWERSSEEELKQGSE